MPTTNLSGRALAEAAAKVMNVEAQTNGEFRIFWRSGRGRGWLEFYPDTDPRADYFCLEWARENWRLGQMDALARALKAIWFSRLTVDAQELRYQPGDYARALVAAAGGGDEQPNPAQ